MDTKGKSLILVKVREMSLGTPEAMGSSLGGRQLFEKNKLKSIRKAEK